MRKILEKARGKRKFAAMCSSDRWPAPSRRRTRTGLRLEALEEKVLLASFPTPLQPAGPAGSQIYDGSVDGIISQADTPQTFTLTLAPNQTLTLVAHPTTSDLQASITLARPDGSVVADASSPAPGVDAVLQAAPIVAGGTYTFVINGQASSTGPYSLQAILNAGVALEDHSGPTDNTLQTAQPIDNTSIPTGIGSTDRLAVLGTIAGGPALGDAYVSAVTGFNQSSDGLIYRIDHATGKIAQTIHVPEFVNGKVEGIKLGPDNTLYVGLYFASPPTAPTTSGELVHLDLQGNELGTIPLPDDPANKGRDYPLGFDVAPDGSFWVAQQNSGNVVHVDPAGSLLQSYAVSPDPAFVALSPTGDVIEGDQGSGSAGLYDLNPSTGTVTFLNTPVRAPRGLNFTPGGDLWVCDIATNTLDRFDPSFHLTQQIDVNAVNGSPRDVQADRNGNVWTAGRSPFSGRRFDPLGTQQFDTNLAGFPSFLTVLGGEFPNIPALPAPDLVDDYSFQLDAGQSASVVVSGRDGHAQVALEDATGRVLAASTPAGTGFDSSIHNFVAPQSGRYYLMVTGDQSTHYSLVVTRGADFGNGAQVNQPAAQDITATLHDGVGGAIGAVQGQSPASPRVSFEGIDFSVASGLSRPPDTIAGVSDQYIVEGVNTAIRVTDKFGNLKLDEPFSQFFAPLGTTPNSRLTDPYVEYDDIVHRWYVLMLDLPSGGGAFLFAVSNDSNPLDGFTEHRFQAGAMNGSGLDFDKMGYNADAVFLTANDFATPGITPVIVAIDKSTILNGLDNAFVSYTSTPPVTEFGTFAPAQMHGATPGMPEFFVSAAGSGNARSVRVATMTDFLSNSPTYVLTDIGVNPYGLPPLADQPGAPGTVQTDAALGNPSFTQADWRDGKLASAQTVGEPDDNFATARVRWYQFSTSGPAPTLIQQGTIHPGPGVSTYFGSIVQDAAGDLGMTYIESSAHEYVSMYVASQLAGSSPGTMGPGLVAAPGQGLMNWSDRLGDYSGIAVDPADGMTFWAANEYIAGPGGGPPTPIWWTRIASFQASTDPGANYYAVNASGGDTLDFLVTTPGGGPGEFVNDFVPALYLYDPSGQLVASFDDPNLGFASVDYQVPRNGAGRYTLKITPSPSTPLPTQGEYALDVFRSIQIVNYQAQAVPQGFVELAGDPNAFTIITSADDLSVPVNLGSDTFTFYNTTYTGNSQLFASSNGLITFGSSNSSASNTNLTTSPTQAAIAPLWSDWIGSNVNNASNPMVLGEITTFNGAPALVVEWNQVWHFSSSPQTISFEAILMLNTGTTQGDIDFEYANLDTGNGNRNGATATVGIKDSGSQSLTGGNLLLINLNNGNNPLVQSNTAIHLSVASPGPDVEAQFDDPSAVPVVSPATPVLTDGNQGDDGPEGGNGGDAGIGAPPVGSSVAGAPWVPGGWDQGATPADAARGTLIDLAIADGDPDAPGLSFAGLTRPGRRRSTWLTS